MGYSIEAILVLYWLVLELLVAFDVSLPDWYRVIHLTTHGDVDLVVLQAEYSST